MSELGKECSRTSKEAFQAATGVAKQIVGDGVSRPSQKIQKNIASVLNGDADQNEKVPLFNCDIFATSDKRLTEYGTTEVTCDCPGLKYKTDIHLCPYNGDRICRHIHRFRVKQRLATLQELLLRASVSVGQLYGPIIYAEFVASPSPEIVALQAYLDRVPEPKRKKKPVKSLTFWDELQELKIC